MTSKTYKFKMPCGRVQRSDTGNPELIAYIDDCLAAHPLGIDSEGNYIVTDETLFHELMNGADDV